MKGIVLTLALLASTALLNGCCTTDICNLGSSSYVPASTADSRQCKACSTCSSCGYDASYTYSGWY